MQTNTDHAVIVGYLRTPFAKAVGKTPGRLSDLKPIDMLVPLVNELITRNDVDPAQIKKILTGAVHPEGVQGMNIARETVLHADSVLPDTVAATTLDMFCASSMEAIALAAGTIKLRPDSLILATGVQSMSQVPMGGFNFLPHPKLDRSKQIPEPFFTNYNYMPATAENLAIRGGITREAQDIFAVRSNHLLAAATQAKRFAREIFPLNGLDFDDGVRPESNVEGLSRLKPLSKNGTITAANASQITDGASAVMMTSESYAAANGLPVLARVIGIGESGCEPHLMGRGPVPATLDALKMANLKMSDMDLIEINEAFAAQVLACLQEWEALGMPVNPEIVNVKGGAIAMGHPLGASGARITGTLALEMKEQNKRYGMATLCVGSGQGKALILENPHYEPGL